MKPTFPRLISSAALLTAFNIGCKKQPPVEVDGGAPSGGTAGTTPIGGMGGSGAEGATGAGGAGGAASGAAGQPTGGFGGMIGSCSELTCPHYPCSDVKCMAPPGSATEQCEYAAKLEGSCRCHWGDKRRCIFSQGGGGGVRWGWKTCVIDGAAGTSHVAGTGGNPNDTRWSKCER